MKHPIKPNDDQISLMKELLDIASDVTRLKIMYSLLDETKCECTCSDCATCSHRCCMIEKSVSDIYQEIEASQSLVSHQLKVLKDHALVRARKDGTKVFYSLQDGHIKQLLKITLEHIMEDYHD